MNKLFSPWFGALFVSMALVVSPLFASAQVVLVSGSDAPAATSTPEVIVQYKDASTPSVVDAAPGVSVDMLVQDLKSDPAVEYAEPNYQRKLMTLPVNDAHAGLEWGLDNTGQDILGQTGTVDADIDAPEAWALSTGTSSVVAVLDTGVDYTHPDIADQMWDGSSCVSDTGAAVAGGCTHGYDFANGDADPMPDTNPADADAFHGTHVAGIIAAEGNNGIGTVGVAPSAKIMAVRFFDDNGNGTVDDEVRAIDFARENGAKIINASYGGTGSSTAEYEAIKRFTDAGGIFVAAAGNDSGNNDSAPVYPCAYDLSNVICVAATNNQDGLASFSNYGAATVDVGAPGESILSLYSSSTPSGWFQGYAFADGTSMATPMTAGEAALVSSYDPSLTSDQVRSLIETSGDAIAALSGKTTSGRRINAYNALLALATTSVATLSGLPSATSTDAVPGLDVTVGGTGVAQYKYALDGGDWSAVTPVSTHIAAAALRNGAHTLSVVGGTSYGAWQDTASSTDYAWTVLDTTAPDIGGLSDDASGVTSKIWTWSSSDPSAEFAYVVDSTTTPDTLGDFSTTTSASAPSDPGTYYLHIAARDNNGNVSATTTVSVVIVAPAPPPPSGGGSSSASSGGGGGGGGSVAPAPAVPSVSGDLTGDGRVDILDFNALMIHWSEHPNAFLDFNSMMVHWTP